MKIPHDISEAAQRINRALAGYSDKDWNYSRIHLQLRALTDINSPYVLWIEPSDDLKTLQSEISWGNRHCDELGILEIVSLRLNKALMELKESVIVRLVKKEELQAQGFEEAFWYEVEEVAGEEFDSR